MNDPSTFDSHIAFARKHFNASKYEDCHAQCLKALTLNPLAREPLFLLARIGMEFGNYTKAVNILDRGLEHAPENAAFLAQKARCLLLLNQRESALETAMKAGKTATEDAETLDTIGVVFSRLGRHEAALPFYTRAVETAPEDAGIWYNLGAARQFMGDFAGARLAFDMCIKFDPKDPRPRVARTTLSKQTPDDNDIEELEKIWEDMDAGDADGALQVGHALAKSYEDLGEIGASLSWLKKAKGLKKATLTDRNSEDRKIVEAAAWLSGHLDVRPDTPHDGPVFICGMPRTGTTLVDRILTSHPQMTPAGELSDFSVVLKRHVKTPGPYVLDAATLKAADQANLDEVGENYIRRVSDTLGLTGRFTDKMPLNIFFAPAILTALPNSRIICLRRHPADTMLSNYRQLFATSFSYYSYSYDLEDTARYVVAFQKMIAGFEEKLPCSRFRIIDYENIIHEQEKQTRDMLGFAGLTFDPACLNFQSNAAPVATASATQVRKSLYSSSIDRWKTYADHIRPGLEILKQEGLITD